MTIDILCEPPFGRRGWSSHLNKYNREQGKPFLSLVLIPRDTSYFVIIIITVQNPLGSRSRQNFGEIMRRFDSKEADILISLSDSCSIIGGPSVQ